MHSRMFPALEREVSAIGLGGMALSIDGRPDEAASIRVIHEALELGVTLIDTADVYYLDDDDIGHNERLIAKALRQWSGDASQVLVATKGGLRRPRGAWVSDAAPAQLRAACEASLRALGVDCIRLYQLHAPGDEVPFADSVGELARLRDEGKVEHLGLSNVSVAQIDEAIAITPIASVQNRANAEDRRAFAQGVVKRCEERALVFLPYSPVGGGRGRERIAKSALLTQIGEAHSATPHEVSLAWLLAKSPCIVPIPGASRVASVRSSVRAASITLDASEVARIDAM